jgi:excisionase family DNA binding protein
MERRFYSADEIAVYLGIREDTVRKWAMRGRIPFVKFGKSLRFDIARINGWVREGEPAYFRKHYDESRT